jgi:chemotaxis protein methyltransferase CheR
MKSSELSSEQFEIFKRMIYDMAGIHMYDGKEVLVKARLAKRLRALNLDSFDEYLEYLGQDSSGDEITQMINVLTTNKTNFFRENKHFEFIRDRLLRELQSERRPLRFWSAGCSSGEEPFTLAITLFEHLPEIHNRDIKILATDISTKVLDKARTGRYTRESVNDIPSALLNKYFSRTRVGDKDLYEVKEMIRRVIKFARLNLMGPWPMKGPFDLIMCRNVMIYFDRDVQKTLVMRYWDLLRPGGYLLVGHSESLMFVGQKFRYIEPAVYQK